MLLLCETFVLTGGVHEVIVAFLSLFVIPFCPIRCFTFLLLLHLMEIEEQKSEPDAFFFVLLGYTE